ncbi:MAG: four-carbon acid sugar kinase family protein [Nitratireductor sp.]|nr:four-carbon acid sugar kinase family protein [Nitratireductor sp.]
MSLLLGAIADDFTGATDLAGTLTRQGMKVLQIIGLPDDGTETGDAEAVVVALKSRTIAPSEAVRQSLSAQTWLRARGVRQTIFKHCSTFDSTAQGNIGPVADALLAATGADFSLVCPALPANGRTVYQGVLFVGDEPLAESPMKDHPLTPMRDSSLIRLLEAQSRHRAGLIRLQTVRAGAAAVRARIEALKAMGLRYGVADAIEDGDLHVLARAIRDHPLVIGGSGVALGLPAEYGMADRTAAPVLPAARGRALILAGSCSTATRQQTARAAALWPARKLTADAATASHAARELADWAAAQPAAAPVMIYSSADPQEVAAMQARYGRAEAGALIERILGDVARDLHRRGFNRIVVAGGETSGAVLSALGVTAIRIGPEIAPGVPWCAAPGLAIALKSGNFGGPDFFSDALGMLE